MSEIIDFKKMQKELYQPKLVPSVVEVPPMKFFMIDGVGNPNTSAAYQSAIATLYGLSYAIKMSKKGDCVPKGYFDYVVPPLESLWHSVSGGLIEDLADKDNFAWTAMLRQPDFVNESVFEWAKEIIHKKKSELDLSKVCFETLDEGLCLQILHIGSYDNEPEATAKMDEFLANSEYQADFSQNRRHHEIYLSDPRKTAPEKLKTVIRIPIKKA
ncbi:MAG: GyrI-like domain-containing protein [Clostridiales bacterium]|jgi:hypothetical protein|nr:GyrI-like domain-containing protein [Clostridiales bacterium]